MGQKSILNKTQKKFLELVVKEPYLVKNFYWTGGTVLSEFYLKHRESYDIDLFSEREIHLPSINKFVSITASKMGSKKVLHRTFLGLHTYTMFIKNNQLKVDFNYYPFTRINKGGKWKGFSIDSLEDIAANKIHTVSTKPRERDFVDIFYIFKRENYTLDRIIGLARAKFDWPIDPIQLGQTFANIPTFKETPKMLVPFDRKEMEKFFLNLARDLKKEIFQ